ncbi:hypothetical protein Ddc_11497 [Ditylenchus destructor]|nr:hypothetical protein Ddc_11497 [Ditylenchus destructor]
MDETSDPEEETQMPQSHAQRQNQHSPPSMGHVRALAVDPNLGIDSKYHIGVANSGIHGPNGAFPTAGIPVAVVQQHPGANAPSTIGTGSGQVNYIPRAPVSKMHNGKYQIGRYGERQTDDPCYQIPIEIRCGIILGFCGMSCCAIIVFLVFFVILFSIPFSVVPGF